MKTKLIVAKTDAALASAIANARGDNKRATPAMLEGAIIASTSTNEALLDVIRNSQVDQKQVQARAMAARFYSMDYMADVKSGKVKEARDTSGNVIIPPMTDDTRKRYLSLLQGAAPDAKTLKEGQVRCTAEQWQRKSTLRTWWTRLLAAAGVKTTETRGGKRATKGKTKVAKGAETTAAPAAPAKTAAPVVQRVVNPQEAAKYFSLMAAEMVRFTQLNRTATEKGKASPTEAFAKAVAKFQEEVAKIGNRLAKAKA